MIGTASGIILTAVGFLVLLTTIGLVGRHQRPAPIPGTETQDDVEPLALLQGWYTLSWLPCRYRPSGVWIGLLLALLTWALLLPRSAAASLTGFVTLVVGLEYSLEGFWRGVQRRQVGTALVGLLASLLCLAGMGLHVGALAGHEPPFALPRLP